MTTQTNTLPQDYWSNFDVEEDDLELITNLLLEKEIPLTTDEMLPPLIEHRFELLAQEQAEGEENHRRIYLPAETYAVGEELIFPALSKAKGKVVAVRPGENPDFGPFDVIRVSFDDTKEEHEFAANFPDHILNNPPEPEDDLDELSSAEGVLARYQDVIRERLDARLEHSQEIVRIAGRWFPRALVAEINEGHLNLAEAVLDVADGGPLPTSGLLEHVELPEGVADQLASFSLDYALQEDERFDEVGPAGQVLWFLRRLEPPEVLYTPPRLEYEPIPVDRSALTEELLDLESRLQDEWSDLPATEGAGEVTLSLLFPHWRVGALPLSSQLKPLFPTAYEAPRIRFILVDGHSGDRFPGWVVRERGYVFGLEDWYRSYDVPVGGLVRVQRGQQPGEVIVDTVDRRMRNDWIRTVTISEAGEIGLTMLKQPVGAAYDDLMVIGIIDRQALDEAWMQGKQSRQPVEKIVAHVFRELAKLTPQTAVHAQTLYAAANVIRRMPPAVVFSELVRRPYYKHVGDLYWRFDADAWSAS